MDDNVPCRFDALFLRDGGDRWASPEQRGKTATEYTARANAAVYDELDFEDKQEYEFAVRGLIDAPETLELKDKDGRIIWSQDAFAFLDDYEKAPDSVNPSLWENTKNNHVYGLFEVTDGIYQVRGYDMANLTVVKGDTGWIVFDTLMSVECSQAAMQLIEKNLGHFPVKAVVISHSHVDHFGGIARRDGGGGQGGRDAFHREAACQRQNSRHRARRLYGARREGERLRRKGHGSPQ